MDFLVTEDYIGSLNMGNDSFNMFEDSTESYEYPNPCNKSDGFDPSAIYINDPEEVLDPARINPFFLHIIITHSITFVIGLLGNIFVITVMIGDRKSRNATNLFLVSLAVSDLLLLLLCVPLEMMQYFVVQWNEEGVVCKVTKYIEFLSAGANILTLCAVSLERFIVIVFPMRSRSLCTMRNCRKVIFCVWIAALLISIPVIPAKSGYTIPYKTCNSNSTLNIFYCKEEADDRINVAIYKFIILFAVPALLMVICYTYVIRELWRSTRNMNLLTNAKSFRTPTRLSTVESTGHVPMSSRLNFTGKSRLQKYARNGRGEHLETVSENSTSFRTQSSSVVGRQKLLHQTRLTKGEDAKNARKQVIKMLIIVIFLFLVCWGPKLIFPLFKIVATSLGFDTFLFTPEWYFTRVVFHLIPFVHSCINPIIYSFMSKNFRRSTQRQLARFCSYFGCNCIKCSAPRTAIPMRATGRSTLQGVDSMYSSNYCQLASSDTRHTEIECVSTM